MNKIFCDLCGEEIIKVEGHDAFENSIYIRVERDDKKFEITDTCDDCITEFRQTFSKFIKEHKVGEKRT